MVVEFFFNYVIFSLTMYFFLHEIDIIHPETSKLYHK